MNEALELVKTADCYDFLRTYLRQIIEIDGLTQLRETEVAIWANKFAVENPVDFASLLIQKAHHMKEYLEGELYYGGASEKRTVQKRIEFLELLKNKTNRRKSERGMRTAAGDVAGKRLSLLAARRECGFRFLPA